MVNVAYLCEGRGGLLKLEDVLEATTGFPVFQQDFCMANPSTDRDIVLEGILVNSFPPLLYLKLQRVKLATGKNQNFGAIFIEKVSRR